MDPAESTGFASYLSYVARVYRDDFGLHDAAQARVVAEDWFRHDARHDFRFAEMEARLPEARRFLDLASGLGTVVLRGLQRGFDGYGLEPDTEKLALMRRRVREAGLPAAWVSRFTRAIGETLPYKDASFDVVLSYQTLEHVQDGDAVIAEMLRVVRPGGALHLRCPDYRGTFEGHYLLPWLPLMPRSLARFYLRLLGRPVAGFQGIRYTTPGRLIRALKTAAGDAGLTITIIDVEQERLRERLREKGLPAGVAVARLAGAVHYLRRLFRTETPINLWVQVDRADALRPAFSRSTTRCPAPPGAADG
jgi:SAM-dependent methyltransferase